MPSIAELRAKIPELNGLDDNQALDAIHQVYYPTVDRGTLAAKLGVKPAAGPADESGDFMRGVKKSLYQIPQTAGGALALAGDVTGLDGVRDYGLNVYQKNEDKINAITKPSDSLSSVLEGDGNAVDWAQNAAGYTAGQAGTALLTGGLGGFIGKQLALRGIKSVAERAVESAAAKAVADKVASQGIKYGAAAALGTNNLVQEAGSIYPEAIKQAQQEGRTLDAGDKARIIGSSIAAAAVDTGMDAVMAGRVLHGSRRALTDGAGNIVRNEAGEAVMEGLGKAARREIAGGMGREAVTEGIQTGIERFGAGQDLGTADAIRDYVDSMGVGAMGGGQGGAIAALHSQKVADAGPLSRAANVGIDNQILQLQHDPQPLISFPDGSVGHKQDMEAYLLQFPEGEERTRKRRELMGRDPDTGKRVKPEPEPEQPFVSSEQAEANNVKAWGARHDGVTLGYAQKMLATPGAASFKDQNLMIMPHPSGKGYTVVPAKWLTLDTQAKYQALQKGDEGMLPGPDREAAGGAIRVDSEGGAAPETYGEQVRTAQQQRAIIFNPRGEPFKTRFAAKNRMHSDGLDATHDITPVEGGFVLQPKKGAPADAASVPENPSIERGPGDPVAGGPGPDDTQGFAGTGQADEPQQGVVQPDGGPAATDRVHPTGSADTDAALSDGQFRQSDVEDANGKKLPGLTADFDNGNGGKGFIDLGIKDGRLFPAYVSHGMLRASDSTGGRVRAMYERAIDEAGKRGLQFTSDDSVTAEAARVYDALAKRGYAVEKNPAARLATAPEVVTPRWMTDDGSPVYSVRRADEKPAAKEETSHVPERQEVPEETQAAPGEEGAAQAEAGQPDLSPAAEAAPAATPEVAPNREPSSIERERDNPTSWVIRNKTSGEVIMETGDRKKVDALNTEKYEAVPALQHLQEINTPDTIAYKAARGEAIAPATAAEVGESAAKVGESAAAPAAAEAQSEPQNIPENILAAPAQPKALQERARKVAERVAVKDVDSTAQGMLATARENKAAAWKTVKDLRARIKDNPLGNSHLRLDLLKAEDRHREFQQMERDALGKIEEDAAKQGTTTIKPAKEQAATKPADDADAKPWDLTQDEFAKRVEYRRDGNSANPWSANWGDTQLEASAEVFDHPDLGKMPTSGARLFKTKREAEVAARGAHKRAVRRALMNGTAVSDGVVGNYLDLKEQADKDAARANPKPLDHGELNIPGRTGNIDAELDKHKAEQAATAKKATKARALQNREDKARAKELHAEHADAMLDKYGPKFDRKELAKEFDSMVKWEPAKFITLAEKFAKEQATAPSAAEHIEDGAAEPATPAVIAESLAKDAKRPGIDYKTAKDQLLAQIDATVAGLKSQWSPVDKLSGKEYQAAAKALQKTLDATVTFDVPGDGSFKVSNTIEKLQEFRKRTIASKGFDAPPKPRSTRPDKNMGVSSSMDATIKDMLADGEKLAAYELSKVVGKPFKFTRNKDGGVNVYTDTREINDMPHGVKGYVGKLLGAKGRAWAFIEESTGSSMGGNDSFAVDAKAAEAVARTKLEAVGAEKVAAAMKRAGPLDQAALEKEWMDAAEKSEQSRANLDNMDDDLGAELPVDTESDQFDAAIGKAKNADDPVRWIAENSTNSAYRAIAARVLPLMHAPELVVVSDGKPVAGGVPSSLGISHAVFYENFKNKRRVIFLKDRTFKDHGMSQETVLHEAIHAATNDAIREGNKVANRGTPVHEAVQDLFKLKNAIVAELNQRNKDGTQTDFEKQLHVQMAASDVKEVLAWGMTNPDFQNMLRGIQYQGRSAWAKFVDVVRNLLGLQPGERNALAALIDISDRLFTAASTDPAAEGKANTGEEQSQQLSAGARVAQALQNGISAATLRDIPHAIGNRLKDFRGIGLQALGRRQLVDLYARDFTPAGGESLMSKYSTLMQQMDADKNEAGAEADGIADRWGKLKDGDQLADLMHDATLAQIDPAQDYVAGDNRAAWAGLKSRLGNLTPEARQLYKEARDAYMAHWQKVRSEIRSRIERATPDSPRRAALLEKMDATFYEKVKGVYFPLARFGDYVVTVQNAAGERVSVNFAETNNEAEALRKSLLAKFPASAGNVVSKVTKKKEFNPGRDTVSRGFMQELHKMLDQYEGNEELQDDINQLYLNSMPDLSWSKHGIHRKGTPGFSQDARRAFAQNMFHGARYLSKLRYGDRLGDLLTEMQDHVDSKATAPDYDSVKAQQVVDEMNKRHDSYMNPQSNALSSTLTSLGFIFYLGLSPASAAVNLSQTPLVTLPMLAAKYGFGKASAALLDASKQAAMHRNDISKALKDDELRAYQEAVNAGVIDVSMAHDLAGIASGDDTKAHAKLRPVMKWASWMFHHGEKFNRQATLMAAYRLARDAGQDHTTAYKSAVDEVYNSHFDYASSNRPRLMQGNVARVVFLFKQYAQNMIYTLSRNAVLAAKGDKTALKTFAGLLVSHSMAAGVLGLPVVGLLLSIATALGGDDDDPWDAKIALSNYLAELLGQKPAEVMMHGLSRLTPFDISGRVGLDKLILPDIQEGLEGARAAESWMTAALGPVAGIGLSTAKGLNTMAHGDYLRGLEDILPVSLRNPIKALRFNQDGVKDKTGIPVLDDTTALEELGQLIGFSPSRSREAMEGKAAVYQAEHFLNNRRQALVDQWAHARMAGDEEGTREIKDDIAKFNERNPTRRITQAGLTQSLHNRNKRIREAHDGIYLTKKHRDVADLGKFAEQD